MRRDEPTPHAGGPQPAGPCGPSPGVPRPTANDRAGGGTEPRAGLRPATRRAWSGRCPRGEATRRSSGPAPRSASRRRSRRRPRRRERGRRTERPGATPRHGDDGRPSSFVTAQRAGGEHDEPRCDAHVGQKPRRAGDRGEPRVGAAETVGCGRRARGDGTPDVRPRPGRRGVSPPAPRSPRRGRAAPPAGRRSSRPRPPARRPRPRTGPPTAPTPRARLGPAPPARPSRCGRARCP